MHAVDRTYWVDRSTARVYAPVGGHDAGGGGGGLGPVLVGRFLEGAVRVLSDESSYQLLSRALRKPEGAAADAETVLEKKYNRYARTARHRAPPPLPAPAPPLTPAASLPARAGSARANRPPS